MAAPVAKTAGAPSYIPLTKGAIVVAVVLALWFLPPFGGLKPEAMHMIALFVGTISGLILQPLPQGVIIVLGMGATAITQTLAIGDVVAGFSNTTVWLIFSAFMLSRGFIKTGLGRRIAYLLIRTFGKTSLGTAYAVTAADLIIAPATPSNTARAGGILFPVVRSLASAFGSEPGPTARKIGAFLMLNEYQTNLITSAMFLTAVAPAPLVASLAKQNFKLDITWMGWMTAAVVPGLIALFLVPLIIYKLYPPEAKSLPGARETASQELKRQGAMSWQEWVMLGVFLLTLGLWATGQWNKLNEVVVALVGVSILAVTTVVGWQDVLSDKGLWDTFFWFGGLVGLAGGLTKLNVVAALAATVKTNLSGIHSWLLVLFLVLLVYIYAHYFIASMAAHVTAFFVPLAAVAIALGAPPMLVVLSLGIFSSLNASLTHYGTGPAPIYFGAGYVDQGTWWRMGFLLSLVNLVIFAGIGGLWWKLIGLW